MLKASKRPTKKKATQLELDGLFAFLLFARFWNYSWTSLTLI